MPHVSIHSFSPCLTEASRRSPSRSRARADELGERALRHRLEPARLRGEDDAKRAPVVEVALAAHELLAFEQAHHRRHRLLAQPRPERELSHPQAVLFEQRHQDRAVTRPHLAPAGSAKPLLQELVPALGRLGEQEAEVVPIHR